MPASLNVPTTSNRESNDDSVPSAGWGVRRTVRMEFSLEGVEKAARGRSRFRKSTLVGVPLGTFRGLARTTVVAGVGLGSSGCSSAEAKLLEIRCLGSSSSYTGAEVVVEDGEGVVVVEGSMVVVVLGSAVVGSSVVGLYSSTSLVSGTISSDASTAW